eukprot:XP_020404664.1 uncharacterized protein LOC109944345 [Zea mays]
MARPWPPPSRAVRLGLARLGVGSHGARPGLGPRPGVAGLGGPTRSPSPAPARSPSPCPAPTWLPRRSGVPVRHRPWRGSPAPARSAAVRGADPLLSAAARPRGSPSPAPPPSGSAPAWPWRAAVARPRHAPARRGLPCPAPVQPRQGAAPPHPTSPLPRHGGGAPAWLAAPTRGAARRAPALRGSPAPAPIPAWPHLGAARPCSPSVATACSPLCGLELGPVTVARHGDGRRTAGASWAAASAQQRSCDAQGRGSTANGCYCAKRQRGWACCECALSLGCTAWGRV